MRFAICLLPALLGACAGSFGGDDECSNGVFASSADMGSNEYVDRDNYYSTQQTAPYTAIAGRQHFQATLDECPQEMPAISVIATSENPAVATATSLDGEFDVHGVATGMTTVDLKSANQVGWESCGVVAIASVELAGREFGQPGAFYAGTPLAMILLLDADTQPAVDRDVTVSGAIPLGDKWNHLAIGGAAAGVYPLTIHAGGQDWPVTATVVDQITDIAPRDAIQSAVRGDTAEACFFAHDNGVVVAGVPWQIDIDGKAPAMANPRTNCVSVTGTSGVKTVTAHALGFTAQSTVSFQ
jgi:hypothetical protein